MRPWGCGSSEERSEERGEEVGGERSKFRQSRETPRRTVGWAASISGVHEMSV